MPISTYICRRGTLRRSKIWWPNKRAQARHFRFDAAVDGAMALSLIDAGARYGLVFSDYRLAGGMNGLDLITAIRTLHQGMPPAVAMVTATFDPDLVAAARAAGIPVIPKPLRPPQLRQLLGLPADTP